MALLAPEFSLTYHGPCADGVMAKLPLSRDWWCDAESWELRWMEFIKPLRAFAPMGYTIPRDTLLADFNPVGGMNNRFREYRSSGNPVVSCIEYYDGRALPSGTDPMEAAGGLQTIADMPVNVALWLTRYAPPPGQGVPAYATLGREVEWDGDRAMLTLVLPLKSESYDAPFLHLMHPYTGGVFDVTTEGRVLEKASGSSAMSQGQARECWLIECVVDADKLSGTHVLIRNANDMETFWHFYDARLVMEAGPITLFAGGAVQGFSLAPIYYGQAVASATPKRDKPLPTTTGCEWNADVEWSAIATEADGWTIHTDGHEDGSLRPHVKCVNTTNNNTARPVLWMVSEEHPPELQSVTDVGQSTDGDSLLRRIQWQSTDRYRGGNGRAEIHASADTAYGDWREGAKVTLRMGWGTGGDLEPRDVARAYIEMGGLPRQASDSASPQTATLAIRVGTYDRVRLAQKHVVDARQAGGRTVREWAEWFVTTVGLSVSALHVADDVANTVIPLSSIPGIPNLYPQDGSQWSTHLDAVEKACDIRVGFSREIDGTLYDAFVDAGPPDYEVGVSEISFVVDQSTLTETDFIRELTHEETISEFRNMAKFITGDQKRPDETYWVESVSDRTAGIGDLWPMVMEDFEESVGPDVLQSRFLRDYYNGGQSAIVWVGPARPDLWPDAFVRIDDAPPVRLEAGSVYRIVSHSIDYNSDDLSGWSSFRAVRVYRAA